METEEKLLVLAKVARALNAAHIVWAVGASALLFLEGVADDFADFDLLIAPESLLSAIAVFGALGASRSAPTPPAVAYATTSFVEYGLDGVEFDLLCDFAIRRKEAVYRYPFDAERIVGSTNVHGESLPLTPLADWFVLYLLMPGRSKKAAMIARHLKANPNSNSRVWLSFWLRSRLPGDVRESVMALYSALA